MGCGLWIVDVGAEVEDSSYGRVKVGWLRIGMVEGSTVVEGVKEWKK